MLGFAFSFWHWEGEVPAEPQLGKMRNLARGSAGVSTFRDLTRFINVENLGAGPIHLILPWLPEKHTVRAGKRSAQDLHNMGSSAHLVCGILLWDSADKIDVENSLLQADL